jgi:predicted DNA-binding transcriptional regulator AlpA
MPKIAAGDIMGTPGPDAYSIAGFCAAHSISRASFYNLLRAGAAPRIMRVGARVLISREAAAAWRAQREAWSRGTFPRDRSLKGR